MLVCEFISVMPASMTCFVIMLLYFEESKLVMTATLVKIWYKKE